MDIGTLRRLALQLRRRIQAAGYPVDGVILFGSRARNTATPDSDIDLAVLSRNFGHNRFIEGALVNREAFHVHPAIEVVPVSVHDYLADDSISPILNSIKKEGVFLI